jgi:hypothetical protein
LKEKNIRVKKGELYTIKTGGLTIIVNGSLGSVLVDGNKRELNIRGNEKVGLYIKIRK